MFRIIKGLVGFTGLGFRLWARIGLDSFPMSALAIFLHRPPVQIDDGSGSERTWISLLSKPWA